MSKSDCWAILDSAALCFSKEVHLCSTSLKHDYLAASFILRPCWGVKSSQCTLTVWHSLPVGECGLGPAVPVRTLHAAFFSSSHFKFFFTSKCSQTVRSKSRLKSAAESLLRFPPQVATDHFSNPLPKQTGPASWEGFGREVKNWGVFPGVCALHYTWWW